MKEICMAHQLWKLYILRKIALLKWKLDRW